LTALVACSGRNDPPILRVTDDPAVTDCDALAETLEQMELGNYASPARRDRVVAIERGACEAAALTPREALCVSTAQSRQAAQACAPRLLLDVECDTVVAALRAKLGHVGSSYAAQLDHNLVVMATACEEDDWPIPLKGCLAATGELAGCADKLPRELQMKLARRVAAELSR
jgi:hypothetical protein